MKLFLRRTLVQHEHISAECLIAIDEPCIINPGFIKHLSKPKTANFKLLSALPNSIPNDERIATQEAMP